MELFRLSNRGIDLEFPLIDNTARPTFKSGLVQADVTIEVYQQLNYGGTYTDVSAGITSYGFAEIGSTGMYKMLLVGATLLSNDPLRTMVKISSGAIDPQVIVVNHKLQIDNLQIFSESGPGIEIEGYTSGISLKSDSGQCVYMRAPTSGGGVLIEGDGESQDHYGIAIIAEGVGNKALEIVSYDDTAVEVSSEGLYGLNISTSGNAAAMRINNTSANGGGLQISSLNQAVSILSTQQEALQIQSNSKDAILINAATAGYSAINVTSAGKGISVTASAGNAIEATASGAGNAGLRVVSNGGNAIAAVSSATGYAAVSCSGNGTGGVGLEAYGAYRGISVQANSDVGINISAVSDGIAVTSSEGSAISLDAQGASKYAIDVSSGYGGLVINSVYKGIDINSSHVGIEVSSGGESNAVVLTGSGAGSGLLIGGGATGDGMKIYTNSASSKGLAIVGGVSALDLYSYSGVPLTIYSVENNAVYAYSGQGSAVHLKTSSASGKGVLVESSGIGIMVSSTAEGINIQSSESYAARIETNSTTLPAVNLYSGDENVLTANGNFAISGELQVTNFDDFKADVSGIISGVNVVSVAGTAVTSVEDFWADLTGIALSSEVVTVGALVDQIIAKLPDGMMAEQTTSASILVGVNELLSRIPESGVSDITKDWIVDGTITFEQLMIFFVAHLIGRYDFSENTSIGTFLRQDDSTTAFANQMTDTTRIRA